MKDIEMARMFMLGMLMLTLIPYSPPKIVIINGFDAMSANVRKNKKGLFRELSENLKTDLSASSKLHLNAEVIIIQPTMPSVSDSTIKRLIEENHATNAIVIYSLDVSFEEGRTENYLNSYGKSMVRTYYNMCDNSIYAIYGKAGLIAEPTIRNCEPFTNRSTEKKTFNIKFGPDIVGKKKHSYSIVEDNAEKLIVGNSSLFNK